MSANKNGNLRPDGVSASLPLFGPFGISGSYYWNPGAPTAPAITLTGSLGLDSRLRGLGLHAAFLRKGMTSQDTMGYGLTGNISTGVPSVTVNASIPDENGIPQPWKAKVSSIEAGISPPGASVAATYTITPQHIADFLTRYILRPAASPHNELSPFTLQDGVGKVGQASQPPVGFLESRDQDPLGGGMAGWQSSVEKIDPRWPLVPVPPPQSAPDPGGLLGRLQEYRRIYGDF